MLPLHCLDFKMTPELTCCQQRNQCQKSFGPQNLSQSPEAERKQLAEDGSPRYKVEVINVIAIYIAPPEWRIYALLATQLQTPEVGKAGDVSASVGGGLADRKTSVWKPEGLAAVFGERVGKGEMCSLLSWQLHFPPPLFHVGGCDWEIVPQMFRQIC